MIKAGYKETELGEIPTEWALENLGSVLESIFYGITAKSTKEGTDIKFLRTTDIKDFNFTPTDLPFCIITERRTNLSKYLLKKGDIIVARAGTVGISVLVKEDLNNIIFGSYLIKLIFKRRRVDPNFIHYFFQSRFYWNKIYSAQGSTIKNINIPFIKSIIIPVPKLREQQKIAKILSDTDNLISSLDDLIAKKENIKKGLLQELLTKGIGHTEFKDTEIGKIPKDWEIKSLKDIMKIYDSKRIPIDENKRNSMEGEFPYCGANGIIDYINDFIFDGEYILLAEDGGYWGKFEKSSYLINGKFWVNNHAHILNISNKFVGYNLFFMYYFNYMDLSNYISGTTRGKLTQGTLRHIKVIVPSPGEQNRIANTLSDTQHEIEALEQKKEKYKMIKSGLMQQLLTGKVRVK
ncbi:restriction endonuclease subunit S [Ferroplasma sp.]|uniref:restriction endonuclease subunit S n=1 Tax=Ferroplasma sp. TaxID=2591003 RepID=UPI002624A2E8|nr:restriction endonuclease subunit S [Ferroplasma sp.]